MPEVFTPGRFCDWLVRTMGKGMINRFGLGNKTGATLLSTAATLTALLASSSAFAATVTVSSSCSLVNAVASVNGRTNVGGCVRSGSGAETIVLPAQTLSVNTELKLTRSVTIKGDLPGATIVSSAGDAISMFGSRTATQLKLENVTVKPAAGAGGITCLVTNEVNVQLANVTIDGCGTGVLVTNGSLAASKVVDVTGSRIKNCAYGGLYANGVTLNLTDSSITGNTGDGLVHYGNGVDFRVNILRSTLSNNTESGLEYQLGSGGALDGLAISIEASSITGNQDGGITYGGDPSQQMRIYRSLIAQNTRSGQGGGVYSTGQLYVYNSTVSNNTSGYEGGGIYHSGAEFYLWNATIAQNTAAGVGGGVYWSGSQGGVAYSIIAGNSGDTQGNTVSKDINFGSSSGFPRMYNLIGTINGFSSHFPDPSNLYGTLASPLDPKLSALANNGGGTKTMALQNNSPALNRIPTQGYAYENPFSGAPVVDQRNSARPSGGAYDIGAYER
jgi:hypothetical protein